MKKYLTLTNLVLGIILLTGLLSILMIFLPLLQNGDITIHSFDLLFSLNGYPFSAFVLASFLLALLGSGLIFFKPIYKDYLSLIVLVNICAGLFFILSPSFAGFAAEELEGYSLSGWTIAYSCLLFFSALIALALDQSQNKFSVYDIVETGMLIALAIGLDLPGLKIRIGANGGSISFTMIPLFILCLRQGPVKGFIGVGIVYGFITCVLDGWGLIYFPFDYLLGYGTIAIAGFFRKLVFKPNNTKFSVIGIIAIALSCVAGIAGRLAASTLSGMIFYEYDFCCPPPPPHSPTMPYIFFRAEELL